jgi:hypothetical protein
MAKTRDDGEDHGPAAGIMAAELVQRIEDTFEGCAACQRSAALGIVTMILARVEDPDERAAMVAVVVKELATQVERCVAAEEMVGMMSDGGRLQ